MECQTEPGSSCVDLHVALGSQLNISHDQAVACLSFSFIHSLTILGQSFGGGESLIWEDKNLCSE